ncbi:MAG: GAF domain-containing protein [Desulfarculus sp.]|nr:GAF domain-containing protein [Desulfarculus sp.]
MANDPLEQKDVQELRALAREQEAALATYKETLARIYAEFDAKVEELSLIRRVSDVLRQAQDLSGLASGLVEVVIGELPADFVCLLLTDPEMTTLCPAALMDRDWEAARALSRPTAAQCVPLGVGPVGAAVAQGRILILPALTEGLPRPWPPDLPSDARSLLVLPLVARQQILGAMLLISRTPEAFGEEHTRTLTIICDHAAAAMVNVRLIDQLGEINERLLASELDAHQAREYLQHLLDTAGDLILIAGPDGRITYANQAASDLGLDPQGLLGRELASLFSDQTRASLILKERQRLSEELELKSDGGQSLLALVSTTPLERSGEVLAILRDVTRRRVLERQLMHAEKLASVGILAAGVAHEIGNPLSAVSGYAQLLTKDGVSEAERQEFARAIASQAERIDRIIRDLLDYSRPSPYAGQAIEVNQAIEAVLNMFFTSKRLAHHNLDIKRDLARELPPVRMDRDQLQQVVLNLVMNAAQAMDKGGHLTIRTRVQEGWVRIEFQDSGPGIPAAHLPLIFDPFFTTKPVGQGTGLGLSICDRIVSATGGRLDVKSKQGKGTTFTVLLPAAGF